MKRFVDWKIFFPTIAVVGLLAWGLGTWSGLGFWLMFGIIWGALIINGIVAEIEDRRPGGFLGPKKEPEDE